MTRSCRFRSSSSWGTSWNGRRSSTRCSTASSSPFAAFPLHWRWRRPPCGPSWGLPPASSARGVVLMGVIALRPMLRAGYDVRLASGTIAAGGTLGILIPPSVMLIVYAAVAGQSIVKLYAAAMLPGFFLTFLYLVYILGWAIINPKIAPKLPPDQYRIAVPEWLRRLERGRSRSVVPGLIAAAFRPVVARSAGYRVIVRD